MSPELSLLLTNSKYMYKFNVLKSNVFSLGIILI